MKGLTNGTIYLGQGDWLKYEVKENNTTNTPVSLTLEAGTKKDGEYIPPEFLKDHSTLYFDNKIFFYMKPTIINLLFAVVLFFGKFFTKKPLLKVFFNNAFIFSISDVKYFM